MSQIDYIVKFNNGAEMSADNSMAAHLNEGSPRPDHAMLVEVTRISNGHSVPGTFVLVSSAGELPELNGHAKIFLAIDRAKANAKVAGMIKAVGGAANGILQDLMFSPVYMGTDMPWGELQT